MQADQVWTSPTKPWTLCTPERQAKLRRAWSTGNLRWKLDPSQQLIYDEIYASHKTVKSSAARIFCLDVSRQVGKDFIMSILAIEVLYRNRRLLRVPYGAPTKDTCHSVLAPTIESIFDDCPPDLLPHEIQSGTFRTTARELKVPWGAKLELIGVDLHPQWLRGPATFAWFLTETGFMDNLTELMEGVILPQTLTMPHAFGVMASTPPETPGHPWSTKYLPEAKSRSMYAKRVITDCPRLGDDQVEGFIKEYGGRKSTRCRRELFVEHIIESTLAAVPEFQDVREEIVTTEGFDKPPPYRDTYVSLDPGFSHATGGVFGYLDFDRELFMVEGDIALRYLNSREVARNVKAREWQLWGRVPTKPKSWTDEAWADELELMRACFYPGLPIPASPVLSYRDGRLATTTYQRVSDTDSRLISDMATEHGIMISPTDKDESEVALNALRVNIQRLKYRIHPRCVNLIAHLEQAIWNKGRTKLAESAAGGHFDCIPAAVYLNRALVWGKNPNPPVRFSRKTHFVPAGSPPSSGTAKTLRAAFGRRPRPTRPGKSR